MDSAMTNRIDSEADGAGADAESRSASSLVPMLISGLVLIVVGMLAVAALT